MVFPFITFTGIKGGRTRLSDFEFLSIKEFGGKLIHELSAEFTTDADQVTYTVPSGKTFYHLKSKLYPVTDVVIAGNSLRRSDVELTFDGTVKDALTFNHVSSHTDFNDGGGGSGNTGQFETNIVESMAGDGVKQIKLTSTDTTGTYRVSLMGIIETTGSSPKIT
jgi:hypothetical protein